MHEEMEGFAHGYGRGHGYGGNVNDDDIDEAVEEQNKTTSGPAKALGSGDLFVPWRSSKLTRLLQGCLSGGAVALIVNVGLVVVVSSHFLLSMSSTYRSLIAWALPGLRTRAFRKRSTRSTLARGLGPFRSTRR